MAKAEAATSEAMTGLEEPELKRGFVTSSEIVHDPHVKSKYYLDPAVI